jgi:hypothetical protein
MKSPKHAYGLVALFAVLILAVSVLPYLRKVYARSFPEGFRDLDCKGVTCQEGQFCQENVCRAISPPYTNNYFPTSA